MTSCRQDRVEVDNEAAFLAREADEPNRFVVGFDSTARTARRLRFGHDMIQRRTGFDECVRTRSNLPSLP